MNYSFLAPAGPRIKPPRLDSVHLAFYHGLMIPDDRNRSIDIDAPLSQSAGILFLNTYRKNTIRLIDNKVIIRDDAIELFTHSGFNMSIYEINNIMTYNFEYVANNFLYQEYSQYKSSSVIKTVQDFGRDYAFVDNHKYYELSTPLLRQSQPNDVLSCGRLRSGDGQAFSGGPVEVSPSLVNTYGIMWDWGFIIHPKLAELLLAHIEQPFAWSSHLTFPD